MIYLDSAATTLQKPPAVSQAVSRAVRHLASPGRGGYRAAMAAAETLYTCRAQLAELFGAEGPEQVVFTCNATMALNIAIQTLLRPGMIVLLSGFEHNAVTRCVRAIPDVKVLIADAPPFQSERLLNAFRSQLSRADVVICNHVSNVFGFRLPVEELADSCSAHAVPLIVDASQSAGCLPVDIGRWGAAFVAMPGHKGLYGPQGTGILLCRPDVLPTPLLMGGTGSQSLSQGMPDFLPDRLEAGTANVPGIAGLLEGVRFVRRTGVERILAHERSLLHRLCEQLGQHREFQLYHAEDLACQTGVLSFRMAGRDCETVGQRLSAAGIAVRTGLHCAPLAHETAGTLESGTIRVSFSAFNSEREVDTLARVLRGLR